jgi:hypothetical protein
VSDAVVERVGMTSMFLQSKLAAGVVVEDVDCLRWAGACVANGHPVTGRSTLVRRLVWAELNGPIPPGKIIRCTCETPKCVAPEHLELTTYKKLSTELGALGVMSGPVRSARIAAVKRAGKQAKVSQDDVRAIRESDEPGTVLAARHGISESTVSKYRLHHCRKEFSANPWSQLSS